MTKKEIFRKLLEYHCYDIPCHECFLKNSNLCFRRKAINKKELKKELIKIILND